MNKVVKGSIEKPDGWWAFNKIKKLRRKIKYIIQKEWVDRNAMPE